MWTIYKKEIRYYFSTPVAYIVIGLYLLTIGLFLWVIPGEYNIPMSGYAQVDGLFALSPWMFLFLCPALTMRLFTEERQTGTWYLLKIKPVPLWQIVLGKYLAVWTIVLLAQLPCIIHYILVYHLASPVGNIDSGAFYGSFIGLLFLSAAFCAIGVWASSVTRSQIVAFIVALILCFISFYAFDFLSLLFHDGMMSMAVKSLGLNEHYLSLSRGVIDIRDLLWFFTYAALFLLLAIRKLNKQE